MTLTMNVLCNATNGIIHSMLMLTIAHYVGSNLGNEVLVQGLGTVYHTLSGPPNLVTYIWDFLSVHGPIIDQYNTIMTEATDNNSSIYAGSWIGPPAAQYSSTNQTLATFTLVNTAQVTFTSETNSSASNGNGTSACNGTTTGNTANDSKGHLGAIIGGVIGGLALLIAISLAI
ncbi:hypothetical protein BT96DRAFT_948022 [Gymnopus androsaceus JB14]|uniref:Uncharacterized protein n=1 Tax=Gymnopus androsaceus JB14 TaxID=1447944 RepID=A0A6A4GR25_9AGAR|nr:hypothetical protein BT96DRAFT_948022 [Gymnopus androsaceus JB14]